MCGGTVPVYLRTEQNPQHIVSQVNELLNVVHIGLIRPWSYWTWYI